MMTTGSIQQETQPEVDLAQSIQALTAPYGKLWPLHIFNACNPLVYFEKLPFVQALKTATAELGVSTAGGLAQFKVLYQQQQFSQKEIAAVLETYSFSGSENQIAMADKTLSYQELLLEEIQQFLSGNAVLENHPLWLTEGGQVLEGNLSAYFQKQAASGSGSASKTENNSTEALMHPGMLPWIDEQMTKWLSAYLDEGQAVWSMPNQHQPFRYAWLLLVAYDHQMPQTTRDTLLAIAEETIGTTETAITALSALFRETEKPFQEQQDLIQAHLKQLPGWIGYMKYLQENYNATGRYNELLQDYVVVRLIYQTVLEQDADTVLGEDFNTEQAQKEKHVALKTRFLSLSTMTPVSDAQNFIAAVNRQFDAWMAYFNAVDASDMLFVLMQALERAQTVQLVDALSQAFSKEPVSQDSQDLESQGVTAQAVFCIDVRSEPYRRELERLGSIETYGFAGFFGLPISKKNYEKTEEIPLCPILLDSQYIIKEEPVNTATTDWVSQLSRQSIPFADQWTYAVKKIKRDTLATFAYVESLGWFHALTFIKDSFLKNRAGQFFDYLKKEFSPQLQLQPTLAVENLSETEESETQNRFGIAFDDQVTLAKTILKLMGLKQPYADFVILCGHGSQSRNNPYASVLDCGACGSNDGAFNALVLAQILNEGTVRDALSQVGVHIPEQTRFIAALHNTTNDAVNFLNTSILSEKGRQAFAAVQEIFDEATQRNSIRRRVTLKADGQVSYHPNPSAACYDWSQTRPEWGLSKNQAFVVGNRDAFKSLDLEGRCFLHSYDWQDDPDGSVLTVVMTAPMVVGTWINLQYTFSTLDPERLGSGPKYLHNITGLFGSFLGNASDLQVGLPYESLFSNAGTPYHLPQRLLVYIQAPLKRVKNIVRAHENVRALIENQWIRLNVFDPEEKALYTL
ncbi:MAG: putative inorganic carbon transporter subunit DabA [Cyanobacteria bacterium P01_H01_bin.74]